MLNEKEVIGNILQGNTTLYSILVNSYQHSLYSFVLRMTLNREDAEELMQDAFLRAYKYLYKYNPEMSFATWIFRIAINLYKSNYSKKYKRNTIELPEELKSLDGYPETVLLQKESLMEVMMRINLLKEEHRIVLNLRYVDGLSTKEAADVLGVSENALKMRVLRAKNALCKRMGKEGLR